MAAVKPDDNLAGDECGRYAAVDFGGRELCLDCDETCGSGCPEFGREEPADD